MKTKYGHYVLLLSLILISLSAIYAFSGLFPFSQNFYNSYSLQAEAWLNGHLDLSQNYSHLEIAIYNGGYYISFPPFPSIIMLPFVFLFGANTPDNGIALFLALLSGVYSYKIADFYLKNKGQSLILSLFLCVGTNYLHVAVWGAVWYLAQSMAFLFTLMAIHYALTDKKYDSILSLLLLCCAMGCRPFQTVYIPLILYLLYQKHVRLNNGKPDYKKFILRLLQSAIPAMLLGIFYLTLNYLRFDNAFEFGHNYLPEFVESPEGQFSLSYAADNLKTIFFKLPELAADSTIYFPEFNGMAFWLASPLAISYAVYFVLEMLHRPIRGDKILLFGIPCLVLLHLVAISMHKTLGGHQFGSRYTVDCLPALFLGLVYMIKNREENNNFMLNIIPLIFGLLLNVGGSIPFFSRY